DYGGIAYANLTLDSSETILFLWDGMGYYCDGRCYPDTEHSQWTQLISKTRDTSKIARLLKAHGITHLFYSEADFRFLSHHDPTGYHRDAADFFFDEFLSKCGKTEYRDNNSLVIKIICS
ncbi:MAG: hypothetical protein NC238_13965, partial [Dehalobacter sp.]|nr:hypothetical protein [Dehalobacter sp.]